MPPPTTLHLATSSDAPHLASLMTAAFSASDTAFSLIWGAEESLKWAQHDQFSIDGLFTPIQKEGRVTWKAVAGDGRVVGFAAWSLPKLKVDMKETEKEAPKSGPPPLPEGVDLSLFFAKMSGPKSEYDLEKEMMLNCLFVHPEWQRKGIANQLLAWGKERADEEGCKCWLTSSPQARRVYERNGWEVVDVHIELKKFGGKGSYERACMVRMPKKIEVSS